MMLPVFRGSSRTVLAFLMLGILTCLLAGEIDGLLLRTTGLGQYYMTVNVTPVTEELLKALPILLFAFLRKPKRQLLLECAAAVGIGFAILENTYILSGMAAQVTVALALIRGFGAGLMHSLCTLAVGYGMSFVHTKRKLFRAGTFALLVTAVLYHSLYNTIVQSRYSLLGILLPLLTFLPLLFTLKRKKAL